MALINAPLAKTRLTKLAVDRAEYLLPSAELGLLALAEPGLFADKFSEEPEASDPRWSLLFFAAIFSSFTRRIKYSYTAKASEDIFFFKQHYHRYSTNELGDFKTTHRVTQRFSCCWQQNWRSPATPLRFENVAWLLSRTYCSLGLMGAWNRRMTSMKGQITKTNMRVFG